MDVRDTKMKCDNCGSNNMREDVMPEEGIDYDIIVCNDCGYWS